MRMDFRALFVLIALFISDKTKALPTIDIVDAYTSTKLSKNFFLLLEKKGTESSAEAIAKRDFPLVKQTATFFIEDSISLWIKFNIRNKTELPTLFLTIRYFNISNIELYKISSNAVKKIGIAGNQVKSSRNETEYSLDLFLPSEQTEEYLLHIKTTHPLTLPLFIESAFIKEHNAIFQNWAVGIYVGIMMAIFLYNLFLYISTKDKEYLIYTSYVFSWCLAQLGISGFGYKYIWPNYPVINEYAVVITSALAFINAVLFSVSFLHLKKNKKFKYAYISLLLMVGLSVCSIVCNILQKNALAYNILSFVSFVIAILLLFPAAILIKKQKSALFYFIAWSFFLSSLIILTLRNISVIPYNNFSVYASYVGSALEMILLSLALANKINILKQEKETILLSQNIILEKQVKERTTDLENALTDLKDTQVQLVESEKMASLGVLTAGVAHEINNPINFVSANIKPLTLNINDLVTLIEHYELIHTTPAEDMPKLLAEIDALKQQLDIPLVTEEIQIMLQTIKEGASRTAEIVEGLRNFSRLDESDFKNANVHEGIDSTLMLLRSTIPPQIKIIKQYNAVDGKIDCFPGQLNQVFMNIINNAIQAIKAKEQLEDESITIQTMRDEKYFHIRIADTGIGMSEEVKSKVFDPFFTTKKVGEGTGLGLSIVHKIIEKHDGKINVTSTIGKGTTFAIQLAIQPKSMHS